MTKYEFLGDLSRLLADLPEEERKQALHYYEDYFADAGEDNEQEVLTELGSPVEIAEQIKNDNTENISYGEGTVSRATDAPQLYETSEHAQNKHTQNTPETEDGWHKMHGSQNTGSSNNDGWNQTSGNYDNANGDQAAYQQTGQQKSGFFARMDHNNILIMIVVLVITSPIWGTALVSIAGILLGIVSAIIGIFAAMIFGGAGSAIGGVAAIIGGIIGIIAGKTAGGILTIGVGCLLFSLGSAFCICL